VAERKRADTWFLGQNQRKEKKGFVNLFNLALRHGKKGTQKAGYLPVRERSQGRERRGKKKGCPSTVLPRFGGGRERAEGCLTTRGGKKKKEKTKPTLSFLIVGGGKKKSPRQRDKKEKRPFAAGRNLFVLEL